VPTNLKPPAPGAPGFDVFRFQIGIIAALVAAVFVVLAERGFVSP
jgi:hypothetical protein